MPEKKPVEKAEEDKREGKAPSTQAGEFVREEMHHIREGKHGARSTKQAIAIGLSKARRAGVKLPAPKKGKASARTRRSAKLALRRARSRKGPRLRGRGPSARHCVGRGVRRLRGWPWRGRRAWPPAGVERALARPPRRKPYAPRDQAFGQRRRARPHVPARAEEAEESGTGNHHTEGSQWRRTRFRCSQCGMEFDNRQQLDEHNKKAHGR